MSQSLMQNRVVAASAVLSLSLTLFVCAATAMGQEGAEPPNKPRVRRIDERPEPKPPAVSESAPEQTSAQADDPYKELRDQIAAAKAPAEQTRLRIELADQLLAAGMESEANAELRALAAEDRFDPTTFYNLGNRLVRLGDIDSAVTAYRKAIDQRKGNYSRALNNLGAVLLQAGRWDESYDALSAALRLEKFRYAEASFNLGRLYAVRGETDLAVREWQRALAVNPQHSGAVRALANAKSEGRIRVNPDAKSGRTATANARDKSPTLAATALTKTLTVDPDTFALLQNARSARERGRDEDAIGYYRKVLAHTGGYFAPANLELSYSLITLKRGDEAIALLLAVSNNDGVRFPICYYHLARLYEGRGELKLAEENYGRAASAPGSSLQFVLDLSRVREKLADLPGALAALEQYVRGAEKAGRKPDWADERLADLRKKIAAATAVPGKP